MLQWIRDKLQGLIVWFIVSVITLVFILGAGSYFFNRASYDRVLAKINGEPINIDEINSQYYEYIRQFKQYHANQKNYNNFDLDPKKIKQQILTLMVNHKALIHGLVNAGFMVTDQQLLGLIKNNPDFQEDGKLSAEKYANFLKQTNLTEFQHRQLLTNYLLVDQLRNSIFLSNNIQTSEVESFITKMYQTRNLGYVVIPFKKFIQQAISDQSIEDYYNNNKKSFVQPETVSIAYLDLVVSKLMNQVPFTRNDLYKYYQEHQEIYTLPELVNVKHILVKDINNKSKTTIEEILTKLKLGQDFSDLAKKYSDDSSSANNGGNLNWIGRGEFDLAFEQAAFNLKNVGEISEIVQSKFGYHIIQLVERREARVNAFEKVIDQVRKHYQEEEVQNKLQILSETANQDLTKIADQFKIDVQFTSPFTSLGTSSGVASYSAVVLAAFEQKNINQNSELIKLAEDHFVIFKVIDRQVAHEKTLLESREEIKEILQNIAAKQLAQEHGLDFAKKLLAGASPKKLAKTYGVDWNIMTVKRHDKNLNPEILKAAFSLAKPEMQKTFSLVNGDFVVLRLLKITDADLKKMLSDQPNLKDITHQQLMQLHTQLELKLFEQKLFNAAKIKFTNNIEQFLER